MSAFAIAPASNPSLHLTFASPLRGLSPAGELKRLGRTKRANAMIKQVGSTPILERHRATCHCGAVELELSLPDGIVNPRRCDCSMCRRKGAIVASVPLAGIRIVKGADVLRLYQFNTKTAKHYFCSVCGIYTHHQRRSNPQEYGYNVGCLEGVNPFDLGPVPTNDGVNHPADHRAS
jgi:hypothetical protein